MRAGRLCGRILQGLLLGLVLFVTLMNLLALSLDARVFRYENF